MQPRSYAQEQRDYHFRANARHFAWQTSSPYFASTEAELLSRVRVNPTERLLEIGCGEGANLFHLRGRVAHRFGVDSSARKAAFACASTGAAVVTGDAAALPFGDGSFDVVLIRDLLHHLPHRAAALVEAHRVLRPGGRLILLEPNSRSPLVLLQATLIPPERGVLVSTPERLRTELSHAGFTVERAQPLQPLPLARVLLHPLLGASGLGQVQLVARLLDGLNALARRLIPQRAWLYLAYYAVRP